MILFISSYKCSELEEFASEFSAKTNIPIKFALTEELGKNTEFYVGSRDNEFFSGVCGVDFKEIKVCFINSCIYLNPEHLSFEDKNDLDYAMQEWSAALLSLFGIQENAKIINPYLPKYRFASEAEQYLIMQRVGLDCADILLTNSSKDAIDYCEIHGQNVLVKEPVAGYAKSKNFDKSMLANFSRLKFTPCIFQKCQGGSNMEILALGGDFLAFDFATGEQTDIPLGLKEKLWDFCLMSDIEFATFNAILFEDKYYFYQANQYVDFQQALEAHGERFKELLSKYLVRECSR